MKNQHTATLAGYEIPRLGMGTMALAIEGRPTNRNQAIETIHAALDAGVRYLDTAWSYYLPSKPGTGEPEDMGYGEYLVRDALNCGTARRTRCSWPPKPAGCAHSTTMETIAGRPMPALKP